MQRSKSPQFCADEFRPLRDSNVGPDLQVMLSRGVHAPGEMVQLVLDAVEETADRYETALAEGRISVEEIVASVVGLRLQLMQEGLTHPEFVETCRIYMHAGRHAGMFGVYLDYSIFADGPSL